MKEYNYLENLMYAIGMQLYEKDILLNDLFQNKINWIYRSFGYCSTEIDKIKQIEEIRQLQKDFTLKELIQKAMMESDYYRLHQFKWWISNYEDNHKKYNITSNLTITKKDIADVFNKRIIQLKELELNSWRKSMDKNLHHHYYWWIDNLMDDKTNYSLWAFQYNDTRVFDTFHLSNVTDKRLPNIILQYILDNNIISNQMYKDNEIEVINPFIFNNVYNGLKIKYSSNMGGMTYLIYLTAKELQEIYKNIGREKIKKMNVIPFFSYINSLKDDYEKEAKFYLYFKQ